MFRHFVCIFVFSKCINWKLVKDSIVIIILSTHCISGGHLDVVQLLVTSAADIDSQDNRKVSCLMAAFRKGHIKVVKWMVKHVSQFPSDPELQRYIATVTDKVSTDYHTLSYFAMHKPVASGFSLHFPCSWICWFFSNYKPTCMVPATTGCKQTCPNYSSHTVYFYHNIVLPCAINLRY